MPVIFEEKMDHIPEGKHNVKIKSVKYLSTKTGGERCLITLENELGEAYINFNTVHNNDKVVEIGYSQLISFLKVLDVNLKDSIREFEKIVDTFPQLWTLIKEKKILENNLLGRNCMIDVKKKIDTRINPITGESKTYETYESKICQ